MLESPRISYIPNIKATSHGYIFPLESPNANYFLEYQGYWDDEHIVSLKYYSIIDGIAVNTWGRQVQQDKSFSVDTHPLFKLIGDAHPENKLEIGNWSNPLDLNFLIFYQDKDLPSVHYLNDVWTYSTKLESSEIRTKAINPFSNKDLILLDVDNKYLLDKYKE